MLHSYHIWGHNSSTLHRAFGWCGEWDWRWGMKRRKIETERPRGNCWRKDVITKESDLKYLSSFAYSRSMDLPFLDPLTPLPPHYKHRTSGFRLPKARTGSSARSYPSQPVAEAHQIIWLSTLLQWIDLNKRCTRTTEGPTTTFPRGLWVILTRHQGRSCLESHCGKSLY